MGARIFRLGLWLLVGAAVLALLGEFWLDEDVNALVLKMGTAGLAVTGLGAVLHLLGSAGTRASNLIQSHRCARCNTVIPKGQTFCYRHTQELHDQGHAQDLQSKVKDV